MKKNKRCADETIHRLFLAFFLMIQAFLLVFLILFHGEPAVNDPQILPLSYERWNTLVAHPELIHDGLLRLTTSVCFLMWTVSVLEWGYLLLTGGWLNRKGLLFLLGLFLAAALCYAGVVCLIRRYAAEYRMYMNYIKPELILATAFLGSCYKKRMQKSGKE